jgi:hypothetical protein
LIKGLGLRRKTTEVYSFGLHADRGLVVRRRKSLVVGASRSDGQRRGKRAGSAPAAQTWTGRSFQTAAGHEILALEMRNKLRNRSGVSYTSYVEKMFRKNLEFPSQVCDTIGVKIVVKREADIPKVLGELESFLGGSLSRKREKDVYAAFKRSRRGKRVSTEYYVWKAVYDIPLPHPSITTVKRIIRLTKGNKGVQEELKRTLAYYLNNPLDFVIEVQLQDIHSYLMSMARGSPTAHARLKTKQIRSNSFYKLFPKEIYDGELGELKRRLLATGLPSL